MKNVFVCSAAVLIVAGCSSTPDGEGGTGISSDELAAAKSLGDSAGNEDAPGDLACDDGSAGAAGAPLCPNGGTCTAGACTDGAPCPNGTCTDGSACTDALCEDGSACQDTCGDGSLCDANGKCNDGTPCGSDAPDPNLALSANDACTGDDNLNDPLPPDLQGDPNNPDTAAFHFRHGAGLAPESGSGVSAMGYSHGRAMSITVTVVEGKQVEVHTADVFARMKAAASRDGVAIHVVSGFRTMDKQRELYRLYKSGRGNLAAVPGFSNHQSGHALDLNTSGRGVYAWLAKHGATYGFRRTVPSEKWHWEAW